MVRLLKEKMLVVLCITFWLLSESKIQGQNDYTVKTQRLTPIDDLEHVAHFGDAEHRGPPWYDDSSDLSLTDDSDLDSDVTDTSSSVSSDEDSTTSSSSASSRESDINSKATRVYRVCTPCPHDLLKKYDNIGIKWICAGYQRARRSFKSECMMRLRNCQDGTMFKKLYDHRCKNDSYHGRHWFYIYRV